jgi:hypothetical protein
LTVSVPTMGSSLSDSPDDRTTGALKNAVVGQSLLTWGFSKGVYSFHPNLVKALEQGRPPDRISSEILLYAPERAFGLDFGCDVKLKSHSYVGCIVTFQDAEVSGFSCPSVILSLFSGDGRLNFIPLLYPDGYLDFGRDLVYEEHVERYGKGEAERRRISNNIVYDDACRKVLPLLLYLCANNRDLVHEGSRKEVASADIESRRASFAGPKGVSPSPTKFLVGSRIGPSLALADTVSRERCEGDRTVATHLRRAHWHHFWTGPRQGPRKLELRWLAPVLVGEEPEELTATVRAVK